MGKRSNFERVERDYYPTPYEAVVPLLEHLDPETWFMEPCAGDGRLVAHLEKHGHICEGAYDIEPRHPEVDKRDAFTLKMSGSLIITNPPWDRKILHPMIDYFLAQNAEAWLLFDADWMHTKQAAKYMDNLQAIVSVGRVKWIEGSKMTGKDNCCWYLFVQDKVGETWFNGRK